MSSKQEYKLQLSSSGELTTDRITDPICWWPIICEPEQLASVLQKINKIIPSYLDDPEKNFWVIAQIIDEATDEAVARVMNE